MNGWARNCASALAIGLFLSGCAATPAQHGVAAAGAVPDALPPDALDFLTLHQTECPGQAADFADWVQRFEAYAAYKGHKPQIIAAAFAGARENPEIRERAAAQPEFVTPVWTYLERAASGARVAKGKERLQANQALLAEIERDLGVDAATLMGIWGIESDFGDNFGTVTVFEALGNVGFATKRKDFACRELLAALRIVEEDRIPPQRMIGSWAGAMGHSQFLPSNYLTLGIDRDGDGAVDLWDSLPDVFASTANHLLKDGWQRGMRWGMEVILPDNFPYREAELDIERPIAHWKERGVITVEGKALPDLPGGTSILLLAGYRGPAFLVTQNFKTLLKYNYSTSYALAVATLGDRILGGPTIRGQWPESEPPLALAERKELQRLLIRRSYLTGDVDGVIGLKTRQAIRRFQGEIGWPQDGFATQLLLAALRKAAGNGGSS